MTLQDISPWTFYNDDVQTGQLSSNAGQETMNLGYPGGAVRADTVGRGREGLGKPQAFPHGGVTGSCLCGSTFSPELPVCCILRMPLVGANTTVWYHTGDSGLCSEASCTFYPMYHSG